MYYYRVFPPRELNELLKSGLRNSFPVIDASKYSRLTSKQTHTHVSFLGPNLMRPTTQRRLMNEKRRKVWRRSKEQDKQTDTQSEEVKSEFFFFGLGI